MAARRRTRGPRSTAEFTSSESESSSDSDDGGGGSGVGGGSRGGSVAGVAGVAGTPGAWGNLLPPIVRNLWVKAQSATTDKESKALAAKLLKSAVPGTQSDARTAPPRTLVPYPRTRPHVCHAHAIAAAGTHVRPAHARFVPASAFSPTEHARSSRAREHAHILCDDDSCPALHE